MAIALPVALTAATKGIAALALHGSAGASLLPKSWYPVKDQAAENQPANAAVDNAKSSKFTPPQVVTIQPC